MSSASTSPPPPAAAPTAGASGPSPRHGCSTTPPGWSPAARLATRSSCAWSVAPAAPGWTCAASPTSRSPFPTRRDRRLAAAPSSGMRPRSRRVARSDQAALVGGHDHLGAVAEVELAEYPADVGLDSLLGQHQRAGDLAVGQPPRDQLHHLDLARGEAGEPVGVRSVAARLAHELLDEPAVTVGASSASPAAMTRTAATRSSAVASLSRNPLAPARSDS